MRAAWLPVVLIVIAGCGVAPDGGDDEPGALPGAGGFCMTQSDCARGDVCARDSRCWAPSEVRAISVTWTVAGQAANATTCEAVGDFEIDFAANMYGAHVLGFSPVPCAQGKFPVDRLPRALSYVALRAGGIEWQAFDDAGVAAFDVTR